MSDMTPERLEQIRARAEAATPGPWVWRHTPSVKEVRLKATGWDVVMDFARYGMQGAKPLFNTGGIIRDLGEEGGGVDHPDAQFIAGARADVADLLAEVERLTARVAELEAAEPLTLRWSPQDIAFVDDGSVELYLTTTAGQPALLPLDAEHAAALRDDLPGSPTRAEVLREVADTLVASCPDHGERSECRMTCACDVAAELRRDGGAR